MLEQKLLEQVGKRVASVRRVCTVHVQRGGQIQM